MDTLFSQVVTPPAPPGFVSDLPPPFVPYEIAGIGTVIGYQGDTYIVNAPNGAVYGYESQSGTPSAQLAPAEIAYAIAHPPAPPLPARSQATRTILDRLTPTEAAALTACTQPGIQMLILKATAAGTIREDDPDFPTARAGLDALGIIATTRWTALFAP